MKIGNFGGGRNFYDTEIKNLAYINQSGSQPLEWRNTQAQA